MWERQKSISRWARLISRAKVRSRSAQDRQGQGMQEKKQENEGKTKGREKGKKKERSGRDEGRKDL